MRFPAPGSGWGLLRGRGLIGQLPSGRLWIWPLFASYGLFLSATEGVEKALVADLAMPGERGYGATAAFSVAAGLALLAAVWLSLMSLGRPGFVAQPAAGS